MEYEIEKGIECPLKGASGRKSKYPFADMEVGDSFAVPDKTLKQGQQIATRGGRRFDASFLARMLEGEVRIWRVK